MVRMVRAARRTKKRSLGRRLHFHAQVWQCFLEFMREAAAQLPDPWAQGADDSAPDALILEAAEDRSARAAAALAAYRRLHGQDDEAGLVTDLLVDLHHFMLHKGLDPGGISARVQMHVAGAQADDDEPYTEFIYLLP